MVLRGLDPGVRFDERSNKMIKVEELVESDNEEGKEDARTM